MSSHAQTPTLRVAGPDVDTGQFSVIARSYSMDAPSGLGAFDTEELAIAAMNALQIKLDAQGARKSPTKKQVRQAGEEVATAVWNT